MEGPFIVAIVAIVLGIAYAGYEQWLKYKAEREKGGMPAEEVTAALNEMEERLAEHEEQRAALQRRIQNLEAIVTSETWDELQAGEGARRPQLSLPEEERDPKSDADRAAEIARRLRM